MTACGSCGAHNPPGAAWCSQCYAAVSGARAAVPAARDEPFVPEAAAVSAPEAAAVSAPEAAAVPAPGATAAERLRQSALWQPTSLPLPPAPVDPPVRVDQPAWTAIYAPGYAYTPASPAQQPLGLRSRHTTALVVGAIALGGVLQGLFWLIERRHLPIETMVRYSLFGTLVFYGVVLMLISTQLRRSVRLRWTAGPRPAAIAIGVTVGGGLAGLFTVLLMNVTGSLTTDPSIALLASEGDVVHIVSVVLVTVVAAPIVEELLFRGLFAESLRDKGPRIAILLSSLAFAVWHFRPAELRYYAVMGALLGGLYWKRGLVCSMSAHASFNGVLTAIAIWLAVAPGSTVTLDGLQVDAPHGWHRLTASQQSTALPGGRGAVLRGPSGAEVAVVRIAAPGSVTADDLVAKESAMGAAMSDDVQVDASSARVESLPIGSAATIDLVADGDKGQLVMVPSGGYVYVIAFESQGSTRAEGDFADMLSSARVDTTGG